MSLSRRTTRETSRFSSQKIQRSSRARLHPNSIDAICQNLPEPTKAVGENFRAGGDQVHPRGQAVRKGWPLQGTTSRVRARHRTALRKQLTEGNIEPQRANEKQFIEDYKTKLTEVKTSSSPSARNIKRPKTTSSLSFHFHLHG